MRTIFVIRLKIMMPFITSSSLECANSSLQKRLKHEELKSETEGISIGCSRGRSRIFVFCFFLLFFWFFMFFEINLYRQNSAQFEAIKNLFVKRTESKKYVSYYKSIRITKVLHM